MTWAEAEVMAMETVDKAETDEIEAGQRLLQRERVRREERKLAVPVKR
jgi:hypothetical protein